MGRCARVYWKEDGWFKGGDEQKLSWILLHFTERFLTSSLRRVLSQNTTQKSISIVFCVSAIRHDSSLSKYRKQKQSPPWTCAILSISRWWLLLFTTVLAEWRIMTNSAYGKNNGDGLLYSILWYYPVGYELCNDLWVCLALYIRYLRGVCRAQTACGFYNVGYVIKMYSYLLQLNLTHMYLYTCGQGSWKVTLFTLKTHGDWSAQISSTFSATSSSHFTDFDRPGFLFPGLRHNCLSSSVLPNVACVIFIKGFPRGHDRVMLFPSQDMLYLFSARMQAIKEIWNL